MRIAVCTFLLVLLADFSATAEEQNQLAAKKPELEVGLVEFALSRDRDSALLDTDPNNADEFWQERDDEIDAVLDYISISTFDQPALKLDAMVKIDQSLRHLFTVLDQKRGHFVSDDEFAKTKAGLGERVNRVDAFNTNEIKAMLDGRGWFRDDLDGPNAGFYAWLITQHADLDPDFQRSALEMMEQVLDVPGFSKRNYAYLFDRVAGKDQRLQRYGTQGKCVGPGLWEPNEMEAPAEVDIRRAEVGLSPLAVYIARFKDICP